MLMESTSGNNAATVLIADEGGRKQILRSLQGQSTPLESRLLGSIAERIRQARKPDAAPLGGKYRHIAELVLLGGIGLCLWLLAAWD
jgi:hypothetical protein